MTPLKRRQTLVRMGLADPIPTVAQRRLWEWIDSRVPPQGEPDGEFTSFVQWLNKASSWIGFTGAKCYDSKDRRCQNGADMKRADEEGAFPLRWYLPHRYPRPYIPANGQMVAAFTLYQAKEPISLKEVRSAKGAGNIALAKIVNMLGAESLEITEKGKKPDQIFLQLTDHGRGEVEDFGVRQRKASYVR